MAKLRRFSRKVVLLSPLVVLGLCFQNFTELEVPDKPNLPASTYGTTATSVEGAAEHFLRTQWMPELRNLESRFQEKLQFRFDPVNPGGGEMEMNLLGDRSMGLQNANTQLMNVSVVNDRVRLRFTGLDLACDYTPAKQLVSFRTQLKTPGQIQLDHSGRDQTSRLSWQMSW